MYNDINQTKAYINEQIFENEYLFMGELYSKYQKVFFATNENINEYLEICHKDSYNSALSVLGSGDHVLNLVKKGVYEIDCFDINKLTKYFVFGLRFAMIRKFDYNSYLNTTKKLISKKTPLDEITQIINELLPYMENKYKKYWSIINNYNYKLQKENKTNLNLIYMLSFFNRNIDDIVFRNNYLGSITDYNILKNNLNNTKLHFKNVNAIYLDKEFRKKYDIILLSNIVGNLGTYFYYKSKDINKDFYEYIMNIKCKLNDDGILLLEYIHDYLDDYSIKKYPFQYSSLSCDDLNGKFIEVQGNKDTETKDGILILKR